VAATDSCILLSMVCHTGSLSCSLNIRWLRSFHVVQSKNSGKRFQALFRIGQVKGCFRHCSRVSVMPFLFLSDCRKKVAPLFHSQLTVLHWLKRCSVVSSAFLHMKR